MNSESALQYSNEAYQEQGNETGDYQQETKLSYDADCAEQSYCNYDEYGQVLTENPNEYDESNIVINQNSNTNANISEGDDSRKIFVGGLSWDTTNEDLENYFSNFGGIEAVCIKTDRFTQKSRGFGFILFNEASTIDKILAPGVEHFINEKKIDPKRAQALKEPRKKVFVGGIDPDTTEAVIREYFSQFGNIELVEMPFDKVQGKRRAYLFITYDTEESAKAATQSEKHDISGKKCDVRIAVPAEHIRNQRMNQFSPYVYGNSAWMDPYYAGAEYYADPYGYYGNGYYDYYGMSAGWGVDPTYGYGNVGTARTQSRKMRGGVTSVGQYHPYSH